MIEAYQQGEDLHTATARQLLGREPTKDDRQIAKAVNFGFLYGMSAKTFQQRARADYGLTLTLAEATAYRDTFFRTYPGLKAWHRQQGNSTEDTRTVLGRRRVNVTKFTDRVNTPVQGSGADGLKAALALLWERRADCPGAFPIIACHDEIVVEADAEAAEAGAEWLKQAMADGMAPYTDPIEPAVETSIAPTWGG